MSDLDRRASAGLCAYRVSVRLPYTYNTPLLAFVCDEAIDQSKDELLCPHHSMLVSNPVFYDVERLRSGWRRRTERAREKMLCSTT